MLRKRDSYWKLQIAGWSGYGLSTFLAVLPELGPGQVLLVAGFKTVRTALGLAASHALAVVYDARIGPAAIDRWARPGAFRSRWPSGLSVLLGIIALCGLWGFAWLAAYRELTAPLRPASLPGIPPASMPRATLDYAFTLFAWSAIYLGVQIVSEARRTAEARRRLESEMLRYQLNPHFLFNALSSIRAGLAPDQERSRRSISNLSDFLRHALKGAPLGFVSLADELRGLDAYLRVEAERFGSRLEIGFDLEPGLDDVSVPSLLLQPLVENAIKHGGPAPSGALEVLVRGRRRDGEVVIDVWNSLRNNGAAPTSNGSADDATSDGSPAKARSLGIGLRNVRDRLRLAYRDRAELTLTESNGRALARVRLPANP